MHEEFDLSEYRLPQDRSFEAKIIRLYPVLPRETDKVPFDLYNYAMLFKDPGTLDLIRGGNTIGCFYIESPGMRSLLKRLSVDTFEMLTAASSIIRPGVAESGMMQEFIARHKDPKKRVYLIPEMETYLSETYGIMIYQEDVLRVAHHIGGLTLAEADLLRRAMSGKLRSKEAMKQLKDQFFLSTRQRGHSDAVTEELWRQISSFAGYAFCKAHSASYALLSFQVAFLKVHYPAEFMAGVLSNGGGYYSAAVYIQECKRLGLTVLLPCVNKSEYEYTGHGVSIRIGLMAIKNFSRASAERLIGERKRNGLYKALEEFVLRTRLGYEETSSLIRCGAMDCLRQTRPTLMRLLDIYHHRRRLFDLCAPLLFENAYSELEHSVITREDYSVTEKCLIEYEMFDFMVTRHPLDFFGRWTNSPSIVPAADMHRYNGKKIAMIGWYMTSKRIRTKKGDIMKFLSLEDLSATFEAVLFPKSYARYAEKTLSMGPFLVTGIADIENGNNIVVEKIEVLSRQELKSSLLKDSVDHNYYGDEEKISEEEVRLASKLETGKLLSAYLG